MVLIFRLKFVYMCIICCVFVVVLVIVNITHNPTRLSHGSRKLTHARTRVLSMQAYVPNHCYA